MSWNTGRKCTVFSLNDLRDTAVDRFYTEWQEEGGDIYWGGGILSPPVYCVLNPAAGAGQMCGGWEKVCGSYTAVAFISNDAGMYLCNNGNLYGTGRCCQLPLNNNCGCAVSSPRCITGGVREIGSQRNATNYYITTGNSLYTWGCNNQGLLGHNCCGQTLSKTNSPKFVLGGVDYVLHWFDNQLLAARSGDGYFVGGVNRCRSMMCCTTFFMSRPVAIPGMFCNFTGVGESGGDYYFISQQNNHFTHSGMCYSLTRHAIGMCFPESCPTICNNAYLQAGCAMDACDFIDWDVDICASVIWGVDRYNGWLWMGTGTKGRGNAETGFYTGNNGAGFVLMDASRRWCEVYGARCNRNTTVKFRGADGHLYYLDGDFRQGPCQSHITRVPSPNGKKGRWLCHEACYGIWQNWET